MGAFSLSAQTDPRNQKGTRMPTKTTKAGREYEVDGKKFVWHPLDDNDETGNLPDVVIPLRIKLGIIRAMADRNIDDLGAMFDLIGKVAPNQDDVVDEMDVNDFQEMFETWQDEYQALTGASLGE